MSAIRIVIADDHRLFREGLRQICETLGDFMVLGEAENGHEAVKLVQKFVPDVVLMDVNMPELNGVQATAAIQKTHPSVKILILTMHNQDHYVFEAINAGAKGYILKDVSAQELIDAIQKVHQGESILSSEMTTKLIDEFRRLSHNEEARSKNKLTPLEMNILQHVATGIDNRNIAEKLNISQKTVANRLSEIFDKLHVQNRTQAALIALKKGWAELSSDMDENKY